MDERPLVSVVMIAFNEERFIAEAIESVFAQTYRDWELVLVDDGSTDGTAAILRRTVLRDPSRIRCVTHPDGRNRGMSASRNLGVAHSRGEYIAFLDADDVWLPNKLEVQVPQLEAEPSALMVYGPAQWWYSWTGDRADLVRDFVHELGFPPDRLLHPPALLARFLGAEGLSPCVCSVLIRREAVEKVGGFEERFQGLYEDQAFFAKVALAGSVLVSSACLARYRQHPRPKDVAGRRPSSYPRARLAFLSWLGEHVRAEGVRDATLRSALRRELRWLRYPAIHGLYGRAREGPPGRLWRSALRWRLRWLALPVVRNLRAIGFRRLTPFRGGRLPGTPIVTYYWSRFLERHRADIRGRALEVGSTFTLRRYGGGALTRVDALDLTPHSPEITVTADLSRADHLAADSFDCFVVPSTAHVIHDIRAALYHAIRILRPGGALLIDFPCLDYYFPRGLDMGTGRPLFLHWWFTPIQVENLLLDVGLDRASYQIEVYGNLFTRIAYQLNMSAEELTGGELEHGDPGHPLLICVRAVKPERWTAQRPVYSDPWVPEVEPARWNPESGHYAT